MGLTQFTEASLVVWTLYLALLRVGVQALIAGRAVAVLGVPPAFGHAPEVVFMKELACVPLLAEATKPVLTYGGQSLTLTRVCRKLLWGLEILH